VCEGKGVRVGVRTFDSQQIVPRYFFSSFLSFPSKRILRIMSALPSVRKTSLSASAPWLTMTCPLFHRLDVPKLHEINDRLCVSVRRHDDICVPICLDADMRVHTMYVRVYEHRRLSRQVKNKGAVVSRHILAQEAGKKVHVNNERTF
jgi:hypothetical protein